MSAAAGTVREITLRGLLLGIAITLVFTAANVYLGLKVGLTFATSIPAAVISMAVLSAFRDSSILENNIVQTVASAAGTLSAIIFVLPGLLIVGWWVDFPFWTSFWICASGGILGVLFTIPLRRAMVVNTDLPYPEGVAAAEVLEVGEEHEYGPDHRPQELADEVLGHVARVDGPVDPEPDGHGGVEVSAAELADAIHGHHDGHAPSPGDDDPSRVLSLGMVQQDGGNDAVSQEDQDRSPDRLRSDDAQTDSSPRKAGTGTPARPCERPYSRRSPQVNVAACTARALSERMFRLERRSCV